MTSWQTYDYHTMTSAIVGHQYVTVLCRAGTSPLDIIEAMKEIVGDKPHKPFVIVNHHRVYGDDWDGFVEADIADLVLE